MKRFVFFLAVSWLFSPAGFAQSHLPTVVESSDADGDGRLQRSEAPIDVLTRFSEIDTDGDGAIDGYEAAEFERRKRKSTENNATAPTARARPRRNQTQKGIRRLRGGS